MVGGTVPISRYTLIAALVLASSADALPAQFTTVVVPPPRIERAPAPPSVRGDTSIARDTSAAGRMQEMSAWVDSAAVAMGIETTRAESLAVRLPADTGAAAVPLPPADTTGGPVVDTTAVRRGAGRFAEGAPAPDTATPFPLLALLGAGLVGAGLFLRRT